MRKLFVVGNTGWNAVAGGGGPARQLRLLVAAPAAAVAGADVVSSTSLLLLFLEIFFSYSLLFRYTCVKVYFCVCDETVPSSLSLYVCSAVCSGADRFNQSKRND